MTINPFDRKLQGEYIRQKLKELQTFCEHNGIDCNLSFGGGWESKSKFMVDEQGKWNLVQEGNTRYFTSISLKIILTDSDKGDNVKLIEHIMQQLLENIQP